MKKLMKIVPLLLVASLSACINRTGLFEKSLFAYGTVCYFSFKSTSNPKGEQSIKDFSNLLLTYDAMADATINRELAGVYGLNQTNEKTKIDSRLYDLLWTAQQFKKSIPYFNPLMGSLSNKWKDALAKGEALSETVIEEELNKINTSELLLESSSGEYYAQRVGSAQIDLGAIAKGYALDRTLELVQEKGHSDYIFNLGSSSILLGKSNANNRDLYNVGIKELNTKAYLKLNNSFISTSGTSEQGVEIDGQMYSHIINPQTGEAINFYDEIIVIMEDGFENGVLGDALSTSLMLSSLEEIKKAEDKYKAGIIAINDGEIYYKSESITLYNADGQKIS
jgi:thiamine biosynthesis lipoprotein